MKNRQTILIYAFYILVIIVSVIAASCFHFVRGSEWSAAAAFLPAVISAAMIFSRIRRMNRLFISYLEALKYEDYSFRISRKHRAFLSEDLNQVFSDISEKLRRNRLEKELHHQQLQTILKHARIGLISYRENDEVDFVNPAARKILRVKKLRDLNDLDDEYRALKDALRSGTGEGSGPIRLRLDDEEISLSIFISEYVLMGRKYFLASLLNIRNELEISEIDAWQKLIRVLMHEILNSLAPITSLASSAFTLYRNEPDLSPEDREDIGRSLQTISKRSEGLINFVNSYRRVSQLPEIHKEILTLNEVFRGLEKLQENEFARKNVRLDCLAVPENLQLSADREYLEQVLINLLKNAAESRSDNGAVHIQVRAEINSRSRVSISVRDNGDGISRENLDRIFIPFYSGKEGGNGIGLSLSRQIMRAHGGTVSVNSVPGEGSTFILEF